MISYQFSRTLKTGKRTSGHAVVIALSEATKLSGAGLALDKATGGAIARAVEASSFAGKQGQTLIVAGIDGAVADRALLVGLGPDKDLGARAFEDAGGHAVAALLSHKAKTADILLDGVKTKKLKDPEAAAHFLFGAQMRSFEFNKYHTKKKPEDKRVLATLTAITMNPEAAKKAFTSTAAIADGVGIARNVITEPPNIMYPKALAEECRKLAKLGVKVTVLGEEQMRKLGMGALLGVGQGSEFESQMVLMEWNGGKKSDKPVALVGKGVCFDSGGISIKPSAGMEEMKWDMAGAGAVIGTMYALAARKAKVNVVGAVGLVENMPDGNAQRPSDVVVSMSGQTIEVLNTDAEGRLVLCDVIWYTQSKYKPKAIVDLATLTGAIIISLGSHRAGLFSNDDKLAKQILDAGDYTGERLWRMPLGPEYDEMLNCDIADMGNISNGREAGSTTAAQFIQRFTNGIPWAHLDIAGVAWNKKATALTPKGAVGWGVRLLDTWLADNYEK